jgi:hypothetical protein
MVLNLKLKETTVISNVEKLKIFSDAEDISTVTNYKILAVRVTNEEIKKK